MKILRSLILNYQILKMSNIKILKILKTINQTHLKILILVLFYQLMKIKNKLRNKINKILL
jgi:hypothetical protein